jgi:hypothetical protein
MTRHIARLSLAGLIVAGSSGALGAQSSSASTARPSTPAGRGSAPPTARPTVVLVHGAFADGTGWQRVIPLLERDGYNVIAVQNPLTSFSGDVETTKRVIDAQQGPVIVVGHSYVVTQQDKAINPDLERFYATRMSVKTIEVNSSHAVFVSHPSDVARLIEQAASAAAK